MKFRGKELKMGKNVIPNHVLFWEGLIVLILYSLFFYSLIIGEYEHALIIGVIYNFLIIPEINEFIKDNPKSVWVYSAPLFWVVTLFGFIIYHMDKWSKKDSGLVKRFNKFLNKGQNG